MEEERRLAYVGITRAQHRLYLTHAWARMIFGQTQYNPPSRFLEEIPDGLMEEAHGSRGNSRRLRARHLGVRVGVELRRFGTLVAGQCPRPGRWHATARVADGGRRRLRVRRPGSSGRHGPASLGAPSRRGPTRWACKHRRRRHAQAKWGEGVILDLRGSGDKTEVVVRFPSAGREDPAPGLGPPGKGRLNVRTCREAPEL